MKEAKKVQITDPVCKQIQLMLKGGAKQTEVGALMGIHPSTISKIAKAGFSVEKYLENKKMEREREKQVMKQAEEQQVQEEQVPGQIEMDLTPGKQEMSDQVKMMRFMAGQVDKLYMKMETINDTLNQILRVMRKE
jgi:IS30 family transposase